MWVVPTATWVCPPTVMGLCVEVKASSLTGGASSCRVRKDIELLAAASQVLYVQISIFPPLIHVSPLWSPWGCWKVVSAAPPAPCPAGWVAEAAEASLPEPGRRWRSPGKTWTCKGSTPSLETARWGPRDRSFVSLSAVDKRGHSDRSTCILGANTAAASTPPPHIHRLWPQRQTGSHAWPLDDRRTARRTCVPGSVSAHTESHFPSPVRSTESADLLYS